MADSSLTRISVDQLHPNPISRAVYHDILEFSARVLAVLSAALNVLRLISILKPHCVGHRAGCWNVRTAKPGSAGATARPMLRLLCHPGRCRR
jgi:hypothetical protein